MTIATATHDTSTSSVVLLAIRGSSTFMDWAVNARQAPTSPQGFLVDAGNLCHAGFLAVARSMAPQIAAQLWSLLEAKPERRKASVILTGHSAGGAVAALLYMHVQSGEMDATIAQSSPLVSVMQAFRRVHCITFGAPPVSLLPLQSPIIKGNRRAEKSMFFSFVNEGDPVARASTEYVKTLLVLYTTPPAPLRPQDGQTRGPVWPVPQGTLSCAGRIVLLRPRPTYALPGSDDPHTRARRQRPLIRRSSPKIDTDAVKEADKGETIQCSLVTDDQLRGVVFGDPMMHAMKLYAERIESCAVRAVTAGGVGV